MKRWLLILTVLTIPLILMMALEKPMRRLIEDSSNSLRINEVMFQNTLDYDQTTGATYDWVELYNPGNLSVSLDGYGLSDDPDDPFKWIFSDLLIDAKGFIVLYGSHSALNPEKIHLAFSFKAGEEGVYLTHPEGDLLSTIIPNSSHANHSYGYIESLNQYAWQDLPTPLDSNSTLYHKDITTYVAPLSPTFNRTQGFYTNDLSVVIAGAKDSIIYYTLDGSPPTDQSNLYKAPITLTTQSNPNNYAGTPDISFMTPEGSTWGRPSKEVYKGTVLRAVAYLPGQGISPVTSATFFIDPKGADRYSFPVLSLITDPDNLFDYEKGIYVGGKVLDESNVKQRDGGMEANYNQRGMAWEKPVNLTMFDQEGIVAFQSNLGVRTHGAWSRANPQKGLRLFARNIYGDETLNYPLFDDLQGRITEEPITEYKRFLVRASGNDWEFVLFRDIFMQNIVLNAPTIHALDAQASKPTILFINGEYWGLHNLRETVDSYTLSNHYGFLPEDVTILEGTTNGHGTTLDVGTVSLLDQYNELMTYAQNNDLQEPEHYQYIYDRIDLDNFSQYMVAQTYLGNTDWPGNNIRYWRINDPITGAPYGYDGKWRYMLYDTDFGFNIYEHMDNKSDFDSISFASAENGPEWPNPEWSTVLFRNLLENDDFRTLFINTYADYLNTSLASSEVFLTLESYSQLYSKEIKEHHERYSNMEDWADQVTRMKDYAKLRDQYLWGLLPELFDTGTVVTVTIDVNGTDKGHLILNQINPMAWSKPYSGDYFSDIPITITAIAQDGHKFVGWEGIDGTTQTISLMPEDGMMIKALFE